MRLKNNSDNTVMKIVKYPSSVVSRRDNLVKVYLDMLENIYESKYWSVALWSGISLTDFERVSNKGEIDRVYKCENCRFAWKQRCLDTAGLTSEWYVGSWWILLLHHTGCNYCLHLASLTTPPPPGIMRGPYICTNAVWEKTFCNSVILPFVYRGIY